MQICLPILLTSVLFAADALGADRPNIIYLLADDLGQGELGCYGQEIIKTPRLDRMAAEGLRCTQMYAGTSVCAPSRACLLTGRHSGHSPIRGNAEVQPEGQMPLPPGTATLGTLLRANGYATACVGKWGLGMWGTSGNPQAMGFDHFFGYACQRHAHSYFPTYLYAEDQRIPLPGNDGHGARRTYAQNLIQDDALAWVTAHAQGPFFLYYAVTLPHHNFEIDDLGIYADQPWSERQKTYAAMVTRLDSDVGRLLDRLRDLGVDGKTLIVFSGDNGTSVPEDGEIGQRFHQHRGLRGIKRSLYEGALRQPCLVRWPGQVPAGAVWEGPWAAWDVLPTIADLAGIPLPKDLAVDGISVRDLWLTGRADPKRTGERSFYWEIHEGSVPRQAVRRGPWKLVRAAGREELFNLDVDPGERSDIAAAQPALVRELGRLMDAEHQDDPHWPLPRQVPATAPGP